MDQQITFGKFQGWTPLELAKAGEAGRGYLAWGAEHLKSPQWRRVFAEALHTDVQPDVELMAKAMMKDVGDLDYGDALELARGELEQEAEVKALVDAVENRQAAVVAHWAPIIGIESSKLRALARRYEWSDWDQLPVSMFSSAQKHQLFQEFMAAWMEAYDK